MKILGLIAALSTLILGWAYQAQPETPYVVILSGDTDGYLSPCGCSEPMTGGIKRRATAIRSLLANRKGMYLENGAFVNGTGRQDELKAEALAASLKAMGATAIHYSFSETRMGPGMLLALQQLSDNRLVTSSIAQSSTFDVAQSVPSGPFLIGAVDPRSQQMASAIREKAIPMDEAIKKLIQEAAQSELQPVLMLQGDHDMARDLAKKFPQLKLIQYRSNGTPPAKLEYVGQTALATPGEKGKYVLRLLYSAGKWNGYTPVRLDPQYADDKDVKSIYEIYLDTVADEKLLEKLPREKTAAFSGNQKCGSCHSKAMDVWKHSKHAGALQTLEKEKHGRDPECVSCHVVGLESTFGYQSRAQTPQLANVGCESCHGPGAAHSANPYKIRLPKVGEKSCAGCHVVEHSPNFNFKQYWLKVRH